MAESSVKRMPRRARERWVKQRLSSQIYTGVTSSAEELQMKAQPSFAATMLMVIAFSILATITMAFVTLPHNVAMHFGEAPHGPATAATYHLT